MSNSSFTKKFNFTSMPEFINFANVLQITTFETTYKYEKMSLYEVFEACQRNSSCLTQPEKIILNI